MKKALVAAFASLATGCVSVNLNDTRKDEVNALTKETLSYLQQEGQLNALYYGPVDNDISYARVLDKKGEVKEIHVSLKYLFKLKAEAQGLEAAPGQPWPAKVEATYVCTSEKETRNFSCSGPAYGVPKAP